MPSKSQWLVQVSAIRAALERFPAPVIDREFVEKSFGVRRRRAIELMHRFGGYQVGRTFLIDRTQLIAALREIEEGAEFHQEQRRRIRLGDQIERSAREHPGREVRIPITRAVMSSRMSRLSEGIALQPGRLEIEFHSTEDLLSKLVELSQAAANDFDAFSARCEAAG